MGFLAPTWFDRAVQQNKDALAKQYEKLKPNAVPWTDDIKRQEDLCILGETFQPHILFDLPPNTNHPKIPKAKSQRVTFSDGRMHYYHNTFKAGTAAEIYRPDKRPEHMWFTTDIVIPVLSEGVPGGKPKVWMSYTPMELITQRVGISRATGTVLVGGLGLGWFLHKVCERKTVKRVIVVEHNQSLMDTVKPALLARYDLSKVTDWIVGDVYKHIGKFGPDTRHLLDIWPEYGEYDYRFWQLKKTTKYLWGWGQRP